MCIRRPPTGGSVRVGCRCLLDVWSRAPPRWMPRWRLSVGRRWSMRGASPVLPRSARGPGRQVVWLTEWAGSNGLVVSEVGPGAHGKRPKLRRVLSDAAASMVVVEHRDRLSRFGAGYLEAALSAQGGKVLVADAGETTDDLVRDMIEALTSRCARLYGRRRPRNRALRAMTANRQVDPGAGDG